MKEARETKKPIKNKDKDRIRQQKIQHRAEAEVRQRRLDFARTKGHGHALLEQTRILRDVIDPNLLAEEPRYGDTRWPGYAYENAFEATEAFTRAYVDAYPKLHKRYISSEFHPCPVDAEFVRNDPGLMNALYAARQYADALGIPYKPFILGMAHELITTGRYRRLPLPNHLYPGSAKSKATWHGVGVADRYLAAHADSTDDWDERLLAKNYRGDPAQDRTLQFMVKHSSISPGIALLPHRLRKGWISPEQAQRLFAEAAYNNAIRQVVVLPPSTEPTPDLEPYRPHCLGLHRKGIPACASCPWQTKCMGLVARAEAVQVAMTGYKDRIERERHNARDRQRAKRMRDREARLGAGIPELTPVSGHAVSPQQESPTPR